ncbi:MAG TPA: DUF6599 family protein [Dongiaceae bacterium]|nr:DUF6599 family protein [Dongiaceae bacterium]
MKKLVLLALAAAWAVCFASSLCAQTQAPAGKILPAQFAGWQSGPGPMVEWRAVSPDSAVFQEAGLSRSEQQHYRNGRNNLDVQIFEFRDPTGAYEAYTAQLSTKLNPSTVAPLTAAGNDQLIALVGHRLVFVRGIRGASDADLRALLDHVRHGADTTPLPPVRGYLPDADLVQGSQRYALGPVAFAAALQSLNEGKFAAITPEIGFNKGAEAMLAGYHAVGGKTETLVIVEYPTPQIAEQQLKHIQPILDADPALGGATVERKNSLLSVVLSPASAQSAAGLRDNIRYGMSVTWNEGSHTLTDPPWLSVVKNIFIGTLVFCGVALVLGVAFGGVRVLVKKLFPGKVFDRPENIEVLQLGLSGKRIDPRDFY